MNSSRALVPPLTAALVLVMAPAAFGAGACCLFDGGCTNTATEAACGALGGVFLPGADCASGPCGVGACCSDVSCVQVAAYPCIADGREFQGAGTQCADDPCGLVIGACCLFGETCMMLSGPACAAAGGSFVAPGSNCGSGHCTIGACCIGEQCTIMSQFECGLKRGTFHDDLDCTKNPCLPPDLCPDGTLFSQSPEPPTGFLSGTSEESSVFTRYEDFSGVAGPVTAIRWWGLDMEPQGGSLWTKCAESDPTFTITFHEDAGGVPGAEVCSYTLLAVRTPLGIDYLGSDLNQYDVTLPSPCVMVNGWISIVGMGDEDCWFLWMSSAIGFSWCTGCLPTQQDIDLSVCLQGPVGGVLGACCDESTGNCTSFVDISRCIAPGLTFAPGTTCEQLDPACGVILGACCFENASCRILLSGDCAAKGGQWLGSDTICSSCPCVTPCPDGGTAEGEPPCFAGYIDEFNGGCTSERPTYSTITPGQIICGTSGAWELGPEILGDFDWYEIDVASAGELHWAVKAQFRPRAWIIKPGLGKFGLTCPGEELAFAAAFECDDLEISAKVTPGTYWLVTGPLALTDTAQCGATYVATATLNVPEPADLNGDGDVDGFDLALLLGQWTGAASYAPCPPTIQADFNGDCKINGFDLATLLGAWG